MRSIQLAAIGLCLLFTSTAWAELKTYDVDPQYRQEVYASLLRILDPAGPGINGGSYGRVQLLPSGQLLVNAPPATLQQVEMVLQAIRNRPAPAAPRVELRYWAVLGSRVTTNPPGTPPPSALNDVLAEMKRSQGDLTFRVLGSAAVTSESGQTGEVDGMTLEVEQTAYVQGDNLNATIAMSLKVGGSERENAWFQSGEVTVRTTLRRGEFVVLGQGDATGALDGLVFFIVHWPAN